MRRLFKTCLPALFLLSLLYAAPCFAEDALPPVFDIRERCGPLTVKDQRASDTCWAAAASTVWEGLAASPEGTVYSQEHLVSDAFSDGKKIEGGNFRTIMAYLAGGRGPAAEGSDTEETALQVRSVFRLSAGSVEEVKETLNVYGPLQASLHMKRAELENGSYYNEETASWYDPDHTRATHDVVILGWDNTYPADAFLQKPSGDGAWICQNSWGETFGKNGIFYVSFDNPCILSNILVYEMEKKTVSEKIYQHDYRGWQGKQGFHGESCYFACVYEAEENELIKAAGFYATGDNSTYDIYLVHNAQDMASLKKRILLKSGILKKTGYYRIELENEVTQTDMLLSEGERFAVVVYIHTPGSELPAAVEMKKNTGSWKIDLDGKESYLSSDGTIWENTQLLYGTNVCLKCYTEPVSEETDRRDTDDKGNQQ